MTPIKQLEESLKASARSKKTKEKEKESTDWLRGKAKTASKENTLRRNKRREKLLGDETRVVTSFQSGALYLFTYDAKYKKELPYWDTSPVIFPLEVKGDTILGLNLHYLQPMLRAKLLDAILDLPRYKTDRQRAKMSYDIVRAFGASDLVKPTIHKYLMNHVAGSIVEIPRDEWGFVVSLPLANFVSLTGNDASLTKVYADSRRKMR